MHLVSDMERTRATPIHRALASLALGVLLAGAACAEHQGPGWKGPTGGPAAPASGGAVRSFDLTAAPTTIQLGSGVRVQAWAFDGAVPGPTLKVRQGDLVRVTLHNRLPVGTTLHWHGLTVPNGEDGVPGITQDSVPPGATAVYSFRADQAGTYWYHSHQDGAAQVDRGLYGALVVAAPGEAPVPVDQVVVLDEWPLGLERPSPAAADSIDMDTYVTYTANGRTGTSVVPIRFQPGQHVRLRFVNVGYLTHRLQFSGVQEVTITEVGGRPVSGATPTSSVLPLAAGDRLAVDFTAPSRPAWLLLADGLPPADDLVVPLLPQGSAAPAAPRPDLAVRDLDLYGLAASASQPAWPDGAAPTRRFTLDLSEDYRAGPGPRDAAGVRYLIDGRSYPDVPLLTVRDGDLVELTLVNTGHYEHPIHLHGHTLRLLARDGRPLPGALLVDTVLVRPGTTLTVGFVADNPGWWMLHCHQLHHAAAGMMALVAYEGAARLAQPRAGSMPD